MSPTPPDRIAVVAGLAPNPDRNGNVAIGLAGEEPGRQAGDFSPPRGPDLPLEIRPKGSQAQGFFCASAVPT
jgi:hypothetical protein